MNDNKKIVSLTISLIVLYLVFYSTHYIITTNSSPIPDNLLLATLYRLAQTPTNPRIFELLNGLDVCYDKEVCMDMVIRIYESNISYSMIGVSPINYGEVDKKIYNETIFDKNDTISNNTISAGLYGLVQTPNPRLFELVTPMKYCYGRVECMDTLVKLYETNTTYSMIGVVPITFDVDKK